LRSMLPFRGVSACLSRSCIMLKRQKISTCFFAYDRTVSLAGHVKIWLTSVNPFPWEILPQSDPSQVDLSVGDIRWQSVTKRLEIVQRSQWRAYRKLPVLFRMVRSRTSYDLPFPQNECPKCTAQDQLRDACCHLVESLNTIEYIDKISFAYERCRRLSNYFGLVHDTAPQVSPAGVVAPCTTRTRLGDKWIDVVCQRVWNKLPVSLPFAGDHKHFRKLVKRICLL